MIRKPHILNATRDHLSHFRIILPKNPIAPRWHSVLFTGIILLGLLVVFVSGREVKLSFLVVPVKLVLELCSISIRLNGSHKLIVFFQGSKVSLCTGRSYNFIRLTYPIVQVSKDEDHLVILNTVFLSKLSLENGYLPYFWHRS